MDQSADGTAARARRLAADLLELLQVRLELVALEAREGVEQASTLLVQGAFALVLVSLGLIFLAVFVTVLLWDSERLLALGVFTVVFLGGGLVLGVLAIRRWRRGMHFFRASLGELQRDTEHLRS